MDYVILAEDNKGPSGLAVKFGAKGSQWSEFCRANPKLKTHPQYGCVYYVGNHVNIPDTWPLAQPQIPAPGPNQPPGPAPVGPGAPAPGPIAPASSAGMFGLSSTTVLIGAGVIGIGIVALYFMKKKSAAAA